MAEESPRKYKELYDLSREVFNEELARSFRIDEKASKYLSVVTLLFGVFASLSKAIFKGSIPPSHPLDWTILLLGAGVGLVLMYAWVTLFRIIRIYEFKKIPIAIEFFKDNELSDVYLAMSQGIKDNLDINRNQGDKKSRLLSKSYSAIFLLSIFLLVLSASLVTHRWVYTQSRPAGRSASMSDERKEPAAPKTVSEKPAEVKLPVKAPAFDTVNEGYDPSKLKGKVINTQKRAK